MLVYRLGPHQGLYHHRTTTILQVHLRVITPLLHQPKSARRRRRRRARGADAVQVLPREPSVSLAQEIGNLLTSLKVERINVVALIHTLFPHPSPPLIFPEDARARAAHPDPYPPLTSSLTSHALLQRGTQVLVAWIQELPNPHNNPTFPSCVSFLFPLSCIITYTLQK